MNLKTNCISRRTSFILVFFLTAMISTSFAGSHAGPSHKMYWITKTLDTIPGKHKADIRTIHELDEIFDKIDQMLPDMMNRFHKGVFRDLQEEINDACKSIDFAAIKDNMAFDETEFYKLEKVIQSSLMNLDWNTINEEVIHLMQQAKKEIETIDLEAIKKDLHKATSRPKTSRQ